ncbi:TonB-dependent receptor domain-containing protein [Tardibacter chloracetimidivorans]|uniref:TonB-dependent receptor domain-containing protein n=1 Tax=Tardibacter chloracetimidivorans TaxID=1921510 RepID=UPI001D038B9B|nr:TonB-dependent receptor [Tardibacter chloracetimidivorans]
MSAEGGEFDRTAGNDVIVVTGRSLSTPDLMPPLPVQVLSGDDLAHRRQGGLGETLAGLPGVHLDNFGGGASRPVIRGQTVPRIEILSDGANLFDVSSVSPDHAITTDPLLLDEIEILRGPVATRFGGSAGNGAINLIDSKVPKALPVGGLSGATEVRFGTGDEEKTLVGRVTAGIGPFAVHAEGSRRRSDDYDVPGAFGSDTLRDSFADSASYSFGASWITSKGYLGAAYTRQDSEYGLPGHSHEGGVCHLHGLALHCESHDIWEDPFLGADDGHTAFIKLRSERVDIRGDYDDLLPGVAHTRLRLSYTDYVHDEVDGDVLFSRYSNKVYDGRLELTHVPFLGFSGTLGVQYTHGTFSGLDYNDAHEGRVPREFVTEGAALFLTERRSFGRLDVEISARKDWREITIPFKLENYILPSLLANLPPATLDLATRTYQNVHLRNWPRSKAEPFSASLAGTLNLDDGYSISVSLSRSERMPSVREIYASSNSLATNSFETGLIKGSGSLQKYPDTIETAKAVNLTLRKATGRTRFELGIFYQDIDDYVFARFVDEESLQSGLLYRYLVYTPADATFTGIDGQISHQFSTESRLTVFGDYVRATLKEQDDHLPRIPPGRLGARYQWTRGPASADLEYYRTFAQDRVASYETRTEGYDMLNATLSYRLDVGPGKSVEFYARATNLTNELAFAHTSFVKDQSPLRGRNITLGMRHQF